MAKGISKSVPIFLTFFLLLASSSLSHAMEEDDFGKGSRASSRSTISCSSPSSYSFRKEKSSLKEIWILSIDGGGIRGIIPAQILNHLEQELIFLVNKRVEQQMTERLGRPLQFPFSPLPDRIRLANAFDMMAGTSTGGIITLGLNVPDPNDSEMPLYTTSTLVDIYKDGEKVFPSQHQKKYLMTLFGQKFDVSGLENLFNKYFKSFSFKDALHPVVITAYEMRQERLHLFDSVKARQYPKDNFLMKDVARATSAAPTYFSAATIWNAAGEEHLFADGGVIANNPAMAAYTRAKSLFPQAEKITLLSLGTGKASQDNLSKKKKGGLVDWAPAIAAVMMDGASDFNHHLLQELSTASTPENKFTYIRLQTVLAEKRNEMDNVSKDNIKYLLAIAQAIVHEHQNVLTSFVQNLAESYEKRGYSFFPQIRDSLKAQLQKKRGKLRSLNLEGLEINEGGAWEILNTLEKYQVSNLTELNIATNPLKNDGIELLLQALRTLKTLNISNIQLDSKGLKGLVRNSSSLTSLDLSKNAVGKKINVLRALTDLTDLNISETSTDDKGLKGLIQGLPYLQRFYGDGKEGGGNFIGPEGGRILLETLPHLTELSLKYATAASGVIQALPHHLNLTSLDLSHNQLDDTQTVELSKSLKSNTTLCSLRVYYNLIGNKGAKSMAKLLQKNTTLTMLDLKNNNITEGASDLAVALLYNSTLKTLDLSRNRLSQKGLEDLCKALRKNTGLTSLALRVPSLEPDTRAAFDQLQVEKLSLSIQF